MSNSHTQTSPVSEVVSEIRDFLQDIVGGAKITERSIETAKEFVAAIDAGEFAQTPAEPEYPDAPMVCAELYQVIGNLAHHFGVFEHPDVQKALDNASEHRLVHTDLLPWPKQDMPALSDTSTLGNSK